MSDGLWNSFAGLELTLQIVLAKLWRISKTGFLLSSLKSILKNYKSRVQHMLKNEKNIYAKNTNLSA